jgi:hypothetical protein
MHTQIKSNPDYENCLRAERLFKAHWRDPFENLAMLHETLRDFAGAGAVALPHDRI